LKQNGGCLLRVCVDTCFEINLILSILEVLLIINQLK
jgi:hypothetical protein